MKTAPTTDLPKVWLVSDSPNAFSLFSAELSQSGFEPTKTNNDPDGYKNLVVMVGVGSSSSILSTLELIRSSTLPTVVIAPILNKVEGSSCDHWQHAAAQSNQVLRLLTSELPTAKLVLIKDWVAPSLPIWLSQPTLSAAGIPSGACRVPAGVFYPVGTDDVFSQIISLIAQPHSERSVVLRGQPTSSTSFIGNVAQLYESYHGVGATIALDGEVVVESPDLLYQEIIVNTDDKNIARALARALPSPGGSFSPQFADQQTPHLTQEKNIKKVQKRSNNQVESGSQEGGRIASQEGTLQAATEPTQPDQLFSQLEEVFVDKRSEAKVDQVKTMVKHERVGVKKNHNRKLFFWFGALSSGIAMAILVTIGSFVLFANLHKQLLFNQLRAFVESDQNAVVSPTTNKSSASLVKLLDWQARAFGQVVDSPHIDEAQQQLLLGRKLGSLSELARRYQDQQNLVLNHVVGVSNTNLSQALTDLALLTNRIFADLSDLKAMMGGAVGETDEWGDVGVRLGELLDAQRRQSAYVSQLLPALPSVLGVEESRVYALLLLDSSELRPTGGFVQAVALLTVRDGRIESSRVLSSYDLDEKVGGQVEPPAELSRLLGEKAWFFRDSNWDYDHDVVAERVAWFIEKGLGVRVDGVISIPSLAVAPLLGVVGGLTIVEYNETVVASNLQERLLFYNEAGSGTTNSSFPTVLLKNLISSVESLSSDSLSQLVEALVQQAEFGNVQISLFEPSEQEPFQSLRWTGSLVKPVCPPQFASVSCVIDSIYQVESNVGVNKANRFVTREITHSINIEKSNIAHSRTTKFVNSARSNAWPQGSYKLYLRWVLPPGARVSSVMVGGAPAEWELVNSETPRGAKVVAAFLEIPIQSEREVVISYNIPRDTSLPHSYLFFDQKQPSVDPSKRVVIIGHQGGGRPVRVAPEPSVAVENKLVFDINSSGHSLVVVEYN